MDRLVIAKAGGFPRNDSKGFLIAALLLLCTTSCLAGWKMVAFHSRLTSIEDNERWESRLAASGAYRNGSILFFGDSEIAFWPMAESFGQLPIHNRGLKGELAQDAGERFTATLREVQPRLAVILTGTNDLGAGKSLESTLAHIEVMLAQVGNRAIVCSLLPASGDFAANHPADDIARWNVKLAALAAARGARFLDLYSVLAGMDGRFRPDLTVDGLHPNSDGYALMTTAMLAELSRFPRSAAGH